MLCYLFTLFKLLMLTHIGVGGEVCIPSDTQLTPGLADSPLSARRGAGGEVRTPYRYPQIPGIVNFPSMPERSLIK